MSKVHPRSPPVLTSPLIPADVFPRTAGVFRGGTSWYPELVPEAEWTRDLDHMRAAGLCVLRLFDFAWSAFEPREGDYQFGWCDRLLDLCQTRGFSVIFCTPTATPPRWLGEQYPQIMVELADGTLRRMGARRDACINSPIFRHFCATLAGQLAARYAHHPAIEGWQIDNELVGPEFAPPECHCPECQWQFRDYLKRHYRHPSALNDAWGLRFWNQEVHAWSEIGTPRHERCADGHVIAYGRFFNESIVAFIQTQAAAIRAHLPPGRYLTHNSTGIFDRRLEHRRIAQAVDVAGWDAYPGAAGSPHPAAMTALAHELCRSAHQRPFLVLETGASADDIHAAHWGEMRARGASAVIPWHWRRHRGNVERGGDMIADYDGTPAPGRLERIRTILERLAAAPALPAKIPAAPAAFVFSADMVRSQERARPRWHAPSVRDLAYLRAIAECYEPLWRCGVRCDVLSPDDSPEAAHRLLVVPADEFCDETRAARLRAYVRGGGVLVATGAFAQRSPDGVHHAVPGALLRDLLGGRLFDQPAVGAFTALPTEGEGALAGGDLRQSFQPDVGCMALATAPGGEAVVTRHAFGEGHAYYVAAHGRALLEFALQRACADARIPWHRNPHDATCMVPDLADDSRWLFNHRDEPVEILGVLVPGHDFVRLT